MWALARIKAPLNGGLIRTTALTAALPSPSLRGTLSFVVSESIRYSSSSSSTRWKDANSKDKFAQQAKIQGFKSRAAFKLLEVSWQFILVEDLCSAKLTTKLWNRWIQNTSCSNEDKQWST